jgi:predicted nucleic acid-binding protein
MKVALDTNCLLDAVDPSALSHDAMQHILHAARTGAIELWVSKHSLAELSRADPMTQAARSLAAEFGVLPHYPIGTWDDQVETWDEVAGTWDDARANQAIQEELASLATSGNSIRDRGAYLDALRANADVFVTSDRQLVGSSPAARIRERFGLRVSTPDEFASGLPQPRQESRGRGA